MSPTSARRSLRSSSGGVHVIEEVTGHGAGFGNIELEIYCSTIAKCYNVVDMRTLRVIPQSFTTIRSLMSQGSGIMVQTSSRATAVSSNNVQGPILFNDSDGIHIRESTMNNPARDFIQINHNITTAPDRIQSPAFQVPNYTSAFQWIWSFFSGVWNPRSPPDCQIYAQSLMSNGIGFPLWLPEPNLNLPIAYRLNGVSIGDVGLITPDGGFDYLFNICRPSDDPVNLDGVPENFTPVEALHPSDLYQVAFIFPQNGHVTSGSIESDFSLSVGREYLFQCHISEGAILSIPDGASRQNLRNLTNFQQYACRNAVNWYIYANNIRGRQARNGSIYLVTGCDKAQSWGVAAFSNVTGRNGFSLKFTAPMVGEVDAISTWQSSSVAKTRAGPVPVDYIEGTHHRAQNQCLFLRGFRVTLGKGVSADLLAAAGISRVEDTKAQDIFPSTIPDLNITSGHGSSSVGYFQSSSDGGMSHSNGHQVSIDGDNDVTLFTNFRVESDIWHPCHAINQYLLEQVPNARVAITHDDDWRSVVNKDDLVFPDSSMLISRIQKRYAVRSESGVVSLVTRDLAQSASSTAVYSTGMQHILHPNPALPLPKPKPSQSILPKVPENSESSIRDQAGSTFSALMQLANSIGGRKTPITFRPSITEALGSKWKAKKSDKVILVIGRCGAGKSTFINTAIGRIEAPTSNGLEPVTIDIRPYTTFHPNDNTSRVVLVDVPGFDNPRESDNDILKSIADWLHFRCRSIKLAGIIYLFDICQTRIDPQAGRILSELCPPRSQLNAILATTNWKSDSHQNRRREEELRARCRDQPLLRVMWNHRSAWEVIDTVLRMKPLDATLVRDGLLSISGHHIPGKVATFTQDLL